MNDGGARWVEVGELGRGGQGTTWRVRPAGGPAGAVAVLKRLSLGAVDRWSAVDRFRREIAVLSGLDHPQIPKVLDHFEDEDGSLGLVQAFVDGPTLRALIAGPPVPPARFEAWLRSALGVVGYLHGRVPPVLHRDLSPGNLIVSGDAVHVVDFGAVRGVTGESGTVTAIGTFGFMPLEQARGQATAASDLYALGMTFVCLAAGCEPDALPLDARRGRVDVAAAVARCGLPGPVVAALGAMTEPGLAERAASVEAVLGILSGWPSAPREAGPRAGGRTRAVALGLGLVAALAAGAFALARPSLGPGEVGRLGGLLGGHGRLFGGDPYLYGAVFSPDGGRVLSYDSGHIYLWDVPSGAILGDFSRGSGEFRGAFFGAFSPDGSQALAVTSEDAALWRDGRWQDLPMSQVAWRLSERPSKAFSVRAVGASSGGGWRVALEAWGERFLVLDPVAGQAIWQERLDDDHGMEAAFSRDGRRLALVGGKSRRVRLVDLASGAVEADFALPAGGGLRSVALAPAGDRVAVATDEAVVVREVAASPPGRVAPSGLAAPVPAAPAERILAAPYGDTSRLMSDRPLAFLPDGRGLVVAFENGLMVFDCVSGAERARIPFAPRVASLAVSPDGQTAAVAGEDSVHLLSLDLRLEAAP